MISFLKINPSILSKTHNNYYEYKDMYIQEIGKLFMKEFNFKKNKIEPSTHFPNTRLHYMDVRDYISSDISSMDNTILNQQNPFDYILHLWNNVSILTVEHCEILKKQLDDSINFINKINNFFKNNNSKSKKEIIVGTDIKKYSRENYEAATKYIINKLLNKYKHDDIKKSMNDITNKYITNQINMMNDIYNQCDKITANKFTGIISGIGSYNSRIILFDLHKKIDVYDQLNSDLFATLVDFYLLRRLLDKDYVANAISYTGAYHSLNYIFYLVKYFDFKITNWSYLNGDINEIHDKIKKADDSYDIAQYFLSNPIYQCSNLSGT